jgi:hypothetical protein
MNTSIISLHDLPSLDKASFSLLFCAREAFLPSGGSVNWVSFEHENEKLVLKNFKSKEI